MIKAILRFLFFTVPAYTLTGLSRILFDKEEIIDICFKARRQWRPNIKRQVLQDFIKKCHEQASKAEDKDEKKGE